MYFCIIFSVEGSVIQQVWIVGDEFLQKNYHSYTTLREMAFSNKPNRRPLYLLDAYTVSSHILGNANGIRSPATRIQNCLVRQLNMCKSMPHLIIIVPDNDIIKTSAIKFFDFGAKKMCEEITSWLIRENDRAITARKDSLRRIKRGATMPGEPKVIYVKMLFRPKRDEIQAV